MPEQITTALLFPKASHCDAVGRSSDFPILGAFPFTQWHRSLKLHLFRWGLQLRVQSRSYTDVPFSFLKISHDLSKT